MLYRLIVLTGEKKNQRITVEQVPMTIGQDPDCAIRLDDGEVARKHAVIEHKPDGLYIRDLGSMNRVLVNRHEVRETRLKHNDVIEVGRTRFLVQAVVQAEVRQLGGGVRERAVAVLRWAAAVLVVAVAAGGICLWAKRLMTAAATAERPREQAGVPGGVEPALAVPEDARQVTEELQHMQEALADIRETVRVLAARQSALLKVPAARTPATPGPGNGSEETTRRSVAAMTPAATDEDLRRQAQELLETARGEIEAGRLEEADQRLAGIQDMDPNFLPAYEERARLFERRGMLEKAVGQWLEIVSRSTGTPLHEKALAEHSRLDRAGRLKATAARRRLKIAAVEQYKFQESDDFDEMRILHIKLAPDMPERPINADAVEVEVYFYDQDDASKTVEPTHALAPKDPLTPDAPWRRGEEKVVTATYVVPKGFRQRQEGQGGPRHFYGYVVRVLYGHRLQDMDARPKTLLQEVPADGEAEPGGGEPPAARAS